MRFNRSVFENLRADLLAENGDSIAILVQFFSILMLDEFFRSRSFKLEKSQILQIFRLKTVITFTLKIFHLLIFLL